MKPRGVLWFSNHDNAKASKTFKSEKTESVKIYFDNILPFEYNGTKMMQVGFIVRENGDKFPLIKWQKDKRTVVTLGLDSINKFIEKEIETKKAKLAELQAFKDRRNKTWMTRDARIAKKAAFEKRPTRYEYDVASDYVVDNENTVKNNIKFWYWDKPKFNSSHVYKAEYNGVDYLVFLKERNSKIYVNLEFRFYNFEAIREEVISLLFPNKPNFMQTIYHKLTVQPKTDEEAFTLIANWLSLVDISYTFCKAILKEELYDIAIDYEDDK